MEPLAEAELAELRADLESLRRDLARQLASSADAARPVDLDEPIGRVSRMDAIAQQNMAKANRAAAELRARQVEAALRRLEDDEYGACQGCGEEIRYPRLKARPEAPFCLPCQGQREARR